MSELSNDTYEPIDFTTKAKLRRWWQRNKPRRWVVGLTVAMALLAGYLHYVALTIPGETVELKERSAIRAEVARLLDAEDFARLEKLANGYRESEARTPSGVWKLTVFYSGFHAMVKKSQRDDPLWSSMAQRIGAWQRLYPSSPTPIIANAVVMKRYARIQKQQVMLVQRASTAPADDDVNFVQALSADKAYLEKHKAIASRDPHFYVIWSNLAFALGTDAAQFFDVMNEGMQAFPGYYQLYFAALDYHAPELRGDAKAIEAFANMAVEQTKTQEGLGLYVRVYWYAKAAFFGEDLFRRSDANWRKMSAAIDDVLSRYPDQWNINNFAYLSCLAGDSGKTRQLLERIEGSPVRQVWKTAATYRRCQALAALG